MTMLPIIKHQSSGGSRISRKEDAIPDGGVNLGPPPPPVDPPMQSDTKDSNLKFKMIRTETFPKQHLVMVTCPVPFMQSKLLSTLGPGQCNILL